MSDLVAHTLHTRLDSIEVTQHADGTGVMTFETSTSYARICARIPSGWSIVAWPNTQADWVSVEIAARGVVVEPVDEPAPASPPTPIACPACGDAGQLSVAETYTAFHPARSEPGRIVAAHALTTQCPSEWFDDGADDYTLHCWNCAHRWDVPANVEIDFDDAGAKVSSPEDRRRATKVAP